MRLLHLRCGHGRQGPSPMPCFGRGWFSIAETLGAMSLGALDHV